MVDLKRFKRLFAEELCWVEKADDDFVAKFARFDPENGREIGSEYNYFTELEILNEREELLKQVDACNIILEQIQTL